MDEVTAFIARVRDHYIEQFRAFAAKQKRECGVGASEVKLQLSDKSELFRRMYCVDFIQKDDGEHRVIELQPALFLKFDTISGSFGAASLSIEHLRWDDVLIYHDLAIPPADDISSWFDRWFDPEDSRMDENADLSSVIHCLTIRSGVLSIDLGTAPPDAFWDILDILERGGATSIRVSSSRAEAGDEGTVV
ncbi:MAG TPA: hypothetical protein VFE34_18340 [Dongiaceae bacterium]|jgi:hypothetical protein|nr:hypothetical protein [Dongiaceae bacterium]